MHECLCSYVPFSAKLSLIICFKKNLAFVGSVIPLLLTTLSRHYIRQNRIDCALLDV